jgi:hypothetical protein
VRWKPCRAKRVLAINAAMFVVELASGLAAHSVSLQADALDFLGDAANYALALMVLGMSMRWRSGAALVEGDCPVFIGIRRAPNLLRSMTNSGRRWRTSIVWKASISCRRTRLRIPGLSG